MIGGDLVYVYTYVCVCVCADKLYGQVLIL